MPTTSSPPLLLGHRGVRPTAGLDPRRAQSALLAENTLAALDYALANGCHGIEFDVRYTRDGHSVLCHDSMLDGMEIAATDYACLRRHKPDLASMEDVLARFSASSYLDIELKVAGHEEAMLAALRACPPQRGYVISSFLAEVLLRLYQLDPSLPLGYICKPSKDVPRWSELPISTFCAYHHLVSEQLVADVHSRGIKLFAWTVNDARDMFRLLGWGVDGLISDDPALLNKTCRRAEEWVPHRKSASAGAH